jgi:hypothetical protein
MAVRVGKLMKIAGKITLFAAGLCVIAATDCIGLDLFHRNHEPGKYGKNLEFRLAAYNLGRFDQFSPRPEGADVFSASQAQQIAQSGEAPVGFKWLPLSDYLVHQGGGDQPRGITRVIDGRVYLLVADRPQMILTHTADAHRWGVKSVEMTSSYEYGPVVKAVQITFDGTARDMLRQFTQKYIRHSVAVVVDGQVIVNLGLLSPIGKGVLGLRYPVGEQTEAERLRDSLMK